ncbi:molybdopterin oxidoreductase [Motilibacter deserti]|uniref:Molybdopterin oxidoreductase n=1 Tax=Motilibacter deserti TaxID=2714956 RepID=A0ABX0GQF9_9ACTN|nr:molybdopterin oxidoreductase [Motilibacter deserti]NHC12952.1 molybdopterin oxidoreductase [Motilibacter deserti]
MNASTPRFLQGAYAFEGAGLDKPVAIPAAPAYVVPAGVTAQPVYFRGGNGTDEMVSIVLLRDGSPMRWFPIGAKGATHVALRVVEDLLSDTRLELHVAAPEGVAGTVVVDLGLVEV